MERCVRILRHAWLDASDSRRALPPAAAARLAARVAQSEQRHSGEIRVCVEAGLPLSCLWPPPTQAALPGLVRQRARDWFGRLGVWDTEHNNGVLIYVLLAERAIEIVADRGLARHVPAGTWQAMVAQMGEAFRAGRHEEGLTAALAEVSALLVRHFPADAGTAASEPHPNELPDAIVLI